MARGKVRFIKENYYIYITDNNGDEHSFSVRKELKKKILLNGMQKDYWLKNKPAWT